MAHEPVSPRAMRSTSNCCPGSMPSDCRNSAGRMIWPFVETVVFIQSKTRLTIARVKRLRYACAAERAS